MRLNPRLRKLTSASRTASAPGLYGFARARRLRRVGGRLGCQFQFVQNVEPPPGGQRQHSRRDFVQRVFADFLAAAQAECAADARVQQPQIIVNLGGRRHSRTRIARGILLADRNRRSNSRDFVHVRFFDALEELARISRKRFDVASLPLGIKRVESKAGFARARNPADHRDRVVRNHEVNVLQVVNARPRTRISSMSPGTTAWERVTGDAGSPESGGSFPMGSVAICVNPKLYTRPQAAANCSSDGRWLPVAACSAY